MRRTGLIILCALLLPAAGPEGRRLPTAGPLRGICVFSRDSLYTGTKIGTGANQRLTELRNEAQAETDTERAALQNDQAVFTMQQSTLSPELRMQLQDALAARHAALLAKIAQRTRELEQTRQIVTAQIDAASLTIIKEMERSNQCTLLLARESVLDGEGTVDITPVVIEAMNAKLRTTPFPRVTLPLVEGLVSR